MGPVIAILGVVFILLVIAGIGPSGPIVSTTERQASRCPPGTVYLDTRSQMRAICIVGEYAKP